VNKPVLIKESKCNCCGHELAPSVWAVGNRKVYGSMFGTVEYDINTKYGLRLWELVDDDGVFWEEWPLEHNIKSAWLSATMGLRGDIPPAVFNQTIINLHAPFIS